MSANRYAAMPGMYVGWTTPGAIAPAACLPWRRVGYAITAFLIVAIVTTVIVTGNHYWLDAVAGWVVIAVSALVNRLLLYPFPIHRPWLQQSRSQTSVPYLHGTTAIR